MTLNKGQKLVQMVQMMSARGGVRATELLKRFDLDARSLRRYLADLRDIGVPIHDDGRGGERTVSVDSRWRRSGVQLTLAEVLSLHFGRTLFDFLDGTSFASDLDGAIERLSPAISRAHQDLARQLDTKFLAVGEHTKDYRGDADDVIDTVISCLVYNNPIEARYRKVTGVERRILLHPFTLATYRQGLYLFALDVDNGIIKTYAVERFVEARRIREHFDYPSTWEPRAHIAHAFGIISGEPQDVQIAFAEAEAAYIRERTWHPTQTFRTLPDGRLLIRMRVAVTVELRQWILGFGDLAQVISPDSLATDIGSRLQRAAERYATHA